MLLCPQGQLPKKGGRTQAGWHRAQSKVCLPVGDLRALSSAQRPCQGLVQENNLAVQVLRSECSLFVQQISSLCNAFEACRMGQVMQSLLIRTVQREWPALKSPGCCFLPSFLLIGIQWKGLEGIQENAAPGSLPCQVRSDISLDAKGQAGLPDALRALPGLATAQLLVHATHNNQHPLKLREG